MAWKCWLGYAVLLFMACIGIYLGRDITSIIVGMVVLRALALEK